MLSFRSYIKEDGEAPANNAGDGKVSGVKPGDDPVIYPADSKKYKKKNRDTFAGMQIFDADMDTLMKVRHGKNPRHRYERYCSEKMKESGEAEELRAFGRSNSKKNIVLRDTASGAMTFLRRPTSVSLKEARLLSETISMSEIEKLIQSASALGMSFSVFNEHYASSKFNFDEFQKATHLSILKQLEEQIKEFKKIYKAK